MSEVDTTYFKKRLLAKKSEVETTLSSLNESAKPVDLENPIGRLSRMDAIQQQQMSLHAKQRAELELQQIESALKRIDDDEYGICLKCEEEISAKRLEAKPETPFCVDCQS